MVATFMAASAMLALETQEPVLQTFLPSKPPSYCS